MADTNEVLKKLHDECERKAEAFQELAEKKALEVMYSVDEMREERDIDAREAKIKADTFRVASMMLERVYEK